MQVIEHDTRVCFLAASRIARRLSHWAAYSKVGPTLIDHRHIPAAPALDTLLAGAQRFAEAYWAAYTQLSWDGGSAAETFPNAFPWLEI